MEEKKVNSIGRTAARVIAIGLFLGSFLFCSPAFAYKYGVGLYGAGLYNVGQLSATTTTISSSANPATEGNNLTYTATLSPSTATGAVTFKDAGFPIGTATLGHGSGSLTIAARQGTHFISAVYAGNGNYSTSTSTTLTQTIQASSSGNSGTSGSGGGGGGGGGGSRRGIALPAVSPTVSVPLIPPAKPNLGVQSAKTRLLKALQRRAAALQKTIDRTKSAKTKKRLQDAMKIILKAIDRASK
jgi:hypothetical protein